MTFFEISVLVVVANDRGRKHHAELMGRHPVVAGIVEATKWILQSENIHNADYD